MLAGLIESADQLQPHGCQASLMSVVSAAANDEHEGLGLTGSTGNAKRDRYLQGLD